MERDDGTKKNLLRRGNSVDRLSAAGPMSQTTSQWDNLLEQFAEANLATAAPKQIRANRRHVRAFLLAAAPSGPRAITAAAVSAHVAGLLANGLSIKTARNVLASLGRFCDWLRLCGKLTDNPCRSVRLRRAPEVAPPVLSPAEVVAMIRVARRHGICAEVGLAVLAGLRCSEIARLGWRDVDLEGRWLIVRTSKSGRFRTVPICRCLGLILRLQRRATGVTGWVFPRRLTFPGGWRHLRRPCSPVTLLKRLRPVQEAFAEFHALAGRRVGRGYHLLRHTFATRLAPTTDVLQLADWLGHSDLKMTRRYVRIAAGYNPRIEAAAQHPLRDLSAKRRNP